MKKFILVIHCILLYNVYAQSQVLFWHTKGKMVEANFYQSSSATDDYLYLFGGVIKYDGSNWYTDCVERINNQNKSWEGMSPMPLFKVRPVTLRMGNSIFLIGDEGFDNYEVLELNTLTDEWKTRNEIDDLSQTGAISIDSSAYLIGGYTVTEEAGWTVSTPSDKVFLLDTSDMSKEQIATMPYVVTNPIVRAINDTIYVLGYSEQVTISNRFMRYFPVSNTFEILPNIPFDKINFGFSYNSQIFALRCYYDEAATDSIALYNPKTNTWKTNPITFPSLNHKYGIIENLGSEVYLCGGRIKEDNSIMVNAIDDFYIATLTTDDSHCPTINFPIADTTVLQNESFRYELPDFYCLDNNELSYHAENFPSWLSLLYNPWRLYGLTPSEDANFEVVLSVTDEEGYSVTDTFNINVHGVNSIKEIEESYVIAYPNPARESVTIELPIGDFSNFNLSLLGMNGQILLNKSLSGCRGSISLNDIPTGTYIIQIRTYSKVYTQRLIVE